MAGAHPHYRSVRSTSPVRFSSPFLVHRACETGHGGWRIGRKPLLPENAQDIVQQILQGRAIQRGAGQAAVVEPLPNQYPTFMRLALDVGLTGLPLGVQRVEGQIQIVLGRLARVDRAALAFGSDRALSRRGQLVEFAQVR